MRILGDISPRSTVRHEPSYRIDPAERPEEPSENPVHSSRDISDVPLKITDERYRLERDRLREDEAWQEIESSRERRASSVPATAVDEPEVPEVGEGGNRIHEARIDLGSVSNDLAQEQRQRAAAELFASLGYARQSRPRRAGAPWKVVLVLVMALAGLAGYGYLAMRENAIPMGRLPGVQTTIALHQRMDADKSRVRADLRAARARSDQLIAAGRDRWARWRR